MIVQCKTRWPVQFELMERFGRCPAFSSFFPSRVDVIAPLSTHQ